MQILRLVKTSSAELFRNPLSVPQNPLSRDRSRKHPRKPGTPVLLVFLSRDLDTLQRVAVRSEVGAAEPGGFDGAFGVVVSLVFFFWEKIGGGCRGGIEWSYSGARAMRRMHSAGASWRSSVSLFGGRLAWMISGGWSGMLTVFP